MKSSGSGQSCFSGEMGCLWRHLLSSVHYHGSLDVQRRGGLRRFAFSPDKIRDEPSLDCWSPWQLLNPGNCTNILFGFEMLLYELFFL